MDLLPYKKGLKAYRNGFGFGVLMGTGICLFLGKVIWIFPICLGLLGGAFAFKRKIMNDGNKI